MVDQMAENALCKKVIFGLLNRPYFHFQKKLSIFFKLFKNIHRQKVSNLFNKPILKYSKRIIFLTKWPKIRSRVNKKIVSFLNSIQVNISNLMVGVDGVFKAVI